MKNGPRTAGEIIPASADETTVNYHNTVDDLSWFDEMEAEEEAEEELLFDEALETLNETRGR